MTSKEEDYVEKAKAFCTNKEDEKHLNSTTCGKLAKDCFGTYKGVNVVTVVDSHSFPKVMDHKNKTLVVNKTNIDEFLKLTALQIVRMMDSSKKDVTEKDPEVVSALTELRNRLVSKAPKIHKIKISETGHVEELTDISKYTGSSKERFDEHGKGKGKAGRETIVESTGYVQGSKIKETHDQKKK